MRKLLIALSIMALSPGVFAFEMTSQLLGYTVAEILVTSAVTVGTSEVSSLSISMPKREAQKIQLQVQEYNQTGEVTPYLAEKIAVVHSVDQTLSMDEAVDVLIDASLIILAE